MRRIILLLFLLLPLGKTVAQTGMEGTWHGTLTLGAEKVTLVFHLGDPCTMDSPDQGASGIAARAESLSPMGVKVVVPTLGASFSGIAIGMDKIAGTFVQAGQTLPLTLQRGELVRRRPQTPKPPLPYPVRELTIENDAVSLAATLTAPEGATTALVMVTGSGLQDRDETLFGHKPFAVIADALAKAGIATLRYDDRGFGHSTGNGQSATTDDFASDAEQALRQLRSMGYEKVGILGHSEGGTIAYMLAAKQLPDFVVSLTGMTDRGDSTIYRQVFHQMLAKGQGQQAAEQTAAAMLQAAETGPSPYLRRFAELRPADFLAQVRCPVLALFGEKDLQVISEYNAPLLQRLLPSADVRLYPSLNHLLQHCQTGLPVEYAQIEETISEEAVQAICEFVKKM